MSQYPPPKPDKEEIERLSLAIKSGITSRKELHAAGFSLNFITTYQLLVMRRIKRGEL